MNDGWVKLHRAIIEHPRCSDPEWLTVWVHLLLLATHQPIRMVFGKDVIDLSPGQLITSRDSLAKKTGVHRSKVDRILNLMKIEQQIEQVTSSVSRLITILNWTKYQQVEQRNEPRVSSGRAASEQRMSTNKNIRTEEEKKGESALPLFPSNVQIEVTPPRNPSGELKGHAVLVLTYLNEKAGRKFENRDEMLRPIIKRLTEGNDVEEIKKMIDREIKIQGPNSKWLQPRTLFGTNFYGAFSDRELPVSSGPITNSNTCGSGNF